MSTLPMSAGWVLCTSHVWQGTGHGMQTPSCYLILPAPCSYLFPDPPRHGLIWTLLVPFILTPHLHKHTHRLYCDPSDSTWNPQTLAVSPAAQQHSESRGEGVEDSSLSSVRGCYTLPAVEPSPAWAVRIPLCFRKEQIQRISSWALGSAVQSGRMW